MANLVNHTNRIYLHIIKILHRNLHCGGYWAYSFLLLRVYDYIVQQYNTLLTVLLPYPTITSSITATPTRLIIRQDIPGIREYGDTGLSNLSHSRANPAIPLYCTVLFITLHVDIARHPAPPSHQPQPPLRCEYYTDKTIIHRQLQHLQQLQHNPHRNQAQISPVATSGRAISPSQDASTPLRH